MNYNIVFSKAMLHLYTLVCAVLLVSCAGDDDTPQVEVGELKLTYIFAGDQSLLGSDPIENIAIDQPLTIRFETTLDPSTVDGAIKLYRNNNEPVQIDISLGDNNKLITLSAGALEENVSYKLEITNTLMGAEKEKYEGVEVVFTTLIAPLVLQEVKIDGKSVQALSRVKDIAFTPAIELFFNMALTTSELSPYISLKHAGRALAFELSQIDASSVKVTLNETLKGYQKYQLELSENISKTTGRPFEGLDMAFFTKLDSTLKYPEIPDEELLTKIQQQTFRYFWDFAHPVSGLTRERSTTNETVTSGGSGFGLMAILVGIERGFITREQGVERLEKIITFLDEKSDRFHGAWSHWLEGSTGKVVPFSAKDNGGDLVETAFMVQGLLTVRQYLDSSSSREATLIATINKLWEAVEWNWYTRGGQNVLYWHWSPEFGWEKNHRITGWNEAMIVYVLAAASPTHGIDKAVYDEGWTRSGAMVNSQGVSHYGITLPLRSDMGGPLFFSHYSFLGLDPRKLSDGYANYWQQNVNHSLINQAYCADNPQRFVGYSAYSWGLTASDNHKGYNAHSPNNDLGVITPTAAISSLPYTPEHSMAAIRHFYYILGDQLWGEYGFYDAFNITENWVASSYLAIDQGPILLMIENHRSALLWELFMSAPEVQNGLKKLNIAYE